MPIKPTILIIAGFGCVAAASFYAHVPLYLNLMELGILGLIVVAFRWLWHVENIQSIATALAIIAGIIAISAGLEMVNNISHSLRGKHEGGKTGIVANVSTWQASALVSLESGRNKTELASERIPRTRGVDKLEQGKRVWIHGADVHAVIPNPSTRERAVAAVRDATHGLVGIMTALAAAVLLLGIRSGAPFSARLVRALVALGITLTFALPIASLMENDLAMAAVDKAWVGMRPEGLSFTLHMPLIGIAVLALALVINRGVAMREDLELTV